MLSDKKSERVVIQKRVKEIYNIRSNYVHGTKEIEYNVAIKLRNESVNLLLDCIEVIFENKEYLECSNDKRALNIIMTSKISNELK